MGLSLGLRTKGKALKVKENTAKHQLKQRERRDMQGGESVRAMERDQEGLTTGSAMMKRGRETENLQGQMCVVCCSYQY